LHTPPLLSPKPLPYPSFPPYFCAPN
jgi:hypothetical protein